MLDSGRWMLDDQAMPEEWIIRVEGREYGPADVEMLREWKHEGRVLATNDARRSDLEVWTTAARIPDLFTAESSAAASPPPIQVGDEQARAISSRRGFGRILSDTFRIYARNIRQFFCLSLLMVLPLAGGQLASSLIGATPNVDFNLRTLVADAFGFCMVVLAMVLWPIYVAAIQIVTSEALAGRSVGFLPALNEAVTYWPRVAGLCLFVYGVFILLLSFGLAIAAMLLAGSTSFLLILFALGLLVIQVWLFGRFFINVLFWQQFAVLENAGVMDSLRESRALARSGGNLPWFQRPLWRGTFIVSIWTVIVLAIALVSDWPVVREYFNLIMTTQDPEMLVQKMTAASQAHTYPLYAFGLSILQRILQPLLGIAFVVLYFDSKGNVES